MSNLMTGANILVECLLREGVDCLFGYPGGVTLPFYDVLYDARVRHYLVRHEENACFAAQGYARSTGKVGVCCATSGPGATNLVTGLVDALLDSIPIVAITGQVSTKLIGSDAFQEADTFGITRSCTKHNFLVKSAADLPRAIHEAFYIAASGPKMLELSGRIADGIIVLVGVADGYIAHAKEKIAAGAKSAGRRLEDINLVLWVPCAVSETANAKDAVKAHVARVVAHPLPYVLDPNEQKVLGEIRKTYDYYHHMDQQANHAEVIPDWLVDKFAIAGTVAECKAQIERIKKTGIQQIAIIPYSPPGGSREETIRGFARAMS